MKSKLEQLREVTTVVADTGDIAAIQRYKPVDATTNPSLLLNVAQRPEYEAFIDQAVTYSSQLGGSNLELIENCNDKLAVDIGKKILEIVPGRISTEVSAKLSFDTQATVEKARKLVTLYNNVDVPSDRILIKIASTWEGIRAAEILEKENIQCNLTLLFSFEQAVACAEAGVFLISPFVGRILDWYKAATGKESYLPEEDPGVRSVSLIYSYYKQHNYKTAVMGASFRNTDQIEQLAGCDRLTISPNLLQALDNDYDELEIKLGKKSVAQYVASSESFSTPLRYEERDFRWHMNENAMATEKLAEGIRNFYADQVKLEALIKKYRR